MKPVTMSNINSQSGHLRDVTAAIAALVVKTTHWQVFFHQLRFLVQKETFYTSHLLLVL